MYPLLEKTENKQKQPWVGPYLKKMTRSLKGKCLLILITVQWFLVLFIECEVLEGLVWGNGNEQFSSIQATTKWDSIAS